MLTRLGYSRDLEVSRHTIRTPSSEKIVRATFVVYLNHAPRGSRAVAKGRHRFTAEGEDFVDATIHVVHRAMHGMAVTYQDELRNTPFLYFAYRDNRCVIHQNMMYQNDDDPTLVRMTSLNFGLQHHLVAVTIILDDVRHLCHHY
jgi:hypothetical protein